MNAPTPQPPPATGAGGSHAHRASPPGAGAPPAPPTAASPWVRRWSHLVAPGGTVLDVACGRGRHMQWFAGRGHPVLGVDRDGQALREAAVFGTVLCADIEAGPWPLGCRRFAAVVVTNYLWRPLWPALRDSLEPGGVLICETFTDGQQTIGRPRRAEFLLQPGELLAVCQGLRIVAYEDGFEADAAGRPLRFVQRIAARRPPSGADPAAGASPLGAPLE